MSPPGLFLDMLMGEVKYYILSLSTICNCQAHCLTAKSYFAARSEKAKKEKKNHTDC